MYNVRISGLKPKEKLTLILLFFNLKLSCLFIFSLFYLLFIWDNNKKGRSWFFSRCSGFHVIQCRIFFTTFNMVLQLGKDETLDTNIDETKTKTEIAAVGINTVIAAAMEKLLWQLQTPSVSSLGPPLEPTTPPSGGNQLHAPSMSA